jgi:hypothetical protein
MAHRTNVNDHGRLPLDTTNLVWSLRVELLLVNWGVLPTQWIMPTRTRAV